MTKTIAIMAILAAAGVANADEAISNVAGGWPSSPGTGAYTDILSLPAAQSIDFITITMSHTWSNDLVISVTGDNGSTFSLLANPATGSRDLGQLDGQGLLIPAQYFFVNGTGVAFGSVAGLQIPAGAGNSYNAISWTGGALAAGNYTISMSDTVGGDGAVINGWSIGYTVPAPGALALLGLGGLAVARRRRA